MHRRCYQPSQRGYANYGGKGVRVIERWHTFEAFLADMGEQPDGLTLERKDAALHYSKNNCEWASRLRQARNKTNSRWIEYAGETLCLSEWAERFGIKPKTLRARLDDYGWPIEQALHTPVLNAAESSFVAHEARYGRPARKKE
jgi:hypothetical protein